MSQGWIAFGSALAGAVGGGGAALVGSIAVNRRELTRRVRIRMLGEVLPELVARDSDDLGDAEPQLKALERAAAMSSRGDRRGVQQSYALWRAAQASLGPELTQVVTARRPIIPVSSARGGWRPWPTLRGRSSRQRYSGPSPRVTIPAPETGHAMRAVVDEALAAKEEGEPTDPVQLLGPRPARPCRLRRLPPGPPGRVGPAG